MKCKKLLALALTAAWFVSACTNVFAAANVSETDAAVDVPQTTISQPAEPEADETAQEVVVTEEETVSVQEKQVQDNEGATSGTCGDSLNWSYNTSTGVLTISGSGTMTSHPWDGYKDNIEQVKFSGSVTSICDFAFNNCKNLERITIPASVESIGGGAFFNCINLESVTFASGSKLTTINTTGDVYLSGYGWGYYGAFEGCKNLVKIVIPNSVTSMGKYTFYGCTNLETVVLSNNLEAIKYCAFCNCENLQGITLGSKTTSIENYAFQNCGKMASVKLNNGLKTIGDFAFYKCYALTNITIPASVETIGGGAFYGLKNLKSVTFASGSKLTAINTTGDVYLNNVGWGYYGAFEGCTSLESIVIPNSVTFMGREVFYGCSNLKSVVLSDNLEAIKLYAFLNCENLQGVTLGSKTTSIENYAFQNCGKMASVKLNNGLKTIGDFAFYKCYALTNITIPASVETIGGGAFYGLKNLKSVTFANDSKLTAIYTTGDVYLNNVGWGYYGAFEGCTSLNSIVFPDNITIINKETLIGCTSLKTVTIGKHVTDIAESAFSGCTSLTEVIIPKALNAIQKNAFYNCSALATVKYTGTQARWNTLKNDGISSGGNSYLLNAKNFVYNYSPLASVAVKTKPSKTTYIVGETFSSAGLKLTATYENGTTKVITSGFTCTPSGKLNTLGQQKIVVTYGGKTTAFYVTVNAKQIRVTQKPTKTTYGQGETLNTSGIKVTYTLFDGSTKVVTSGFICTPTKLTTVGTQWITVKFGGTATAFPVKVNEPTVAKIRVTKKPTKTTYVPGNSLNTSGMEVTVTYSNGTTKVITSGFTCTPTKFTAEGLQWITVKYGGTATAFPVNVVKKAKTIRVIQKPTKTTYIVGNSLNTSGLKLRAAYDDGSTKDVTSAFTCYPTKLTTVGTQWITVVYAGQSTAFPIKVTTKPVSSVTIKKLPAKRTYKVGETFNSSGMVLKITYTDNTTAEVTSGFLCTPTGKFTTKGQQKIVVTYGGKSTGFYVTVT